LPHPRCDRMAEVKQYQRDEELVCCVCGEIGHLDYDIEMNIDTGEADISVYISAYRYTCAKCRAKTTATEEGCSKCGADKGECLGC